VTPSPPLRGVHAAVVSGFVGIVTAASPAGASEPVACEYRTARAHIQQIVLTPSTPVGQSFVACESGVLSLVSFEVELFTTYEARIVIREGVDLLAPGTAFLRPMFLFQRRVNFNPAYPVVAGRTYSVSFGPTDGTFRVYYNRDDIPSGTAFRVLDGVSVAVPEYDADFSAQITDPPVPAAPSSWGAVKSIYR